MKTLYILLAIFLLASCRDGESGIDDCLENRNIEFSDSTVPSAVLNQEYLARIRVGINNEPNDDRYNYIFDFDGDLPHGVVWSQNDQERVITLYGTPTELGTFRFELRVTAELPDSESDEEADLCLSSEREDFQIIVREN